MRRRQPELWRYTRRIHRPTYWINLLRLYLLTDRATTVLDTQQSLLPRFPVSGIGASCATMMLWASNDVWIAGTVRMWPYWRSGALVMYSTERYDRWQRHARHDFWRIRSRTFMSCIRANILFLCSSSCFLPFVTFGNCIGHFDTINLIRIW